MNPDASAASEAEQFRALGETVWMPPPFHVRTGERGPDPPLDGASFPALSRPAPRAHLQLLGEIARGGVGTVYRAHDPHLGRDVAIKVLHEAHVDNAALRERFLGEAQLTSQLQHPGVVPVYETGELSDHRPYFTMKLVKGQTLAGLLVEERRAESGEQRAKSREQRASRGLAIFEEICRTMAYAHAHGVIHRDLKPANIMVGAFGEVQVMDWGLAKVLRNEKEQRATAGSAPSSFIHAPSSASPTRPGAVLGTPPYMAPEQAQGAVEELDERCDIFGLGAILCEILTGKPPYTGAHAAHVLRQAAQADLEEAFARLDRCGADAGLIALAKRCLAPAPDNRPRDARALVTELTAYRASRPAKTRLKVELQPAPADLKLVARLDAARLRGVSPLGSGFDHTGAAAEYAAAFREAGLGTETDDPETVAARIRDSAVAGPLLIALDDWARAASDGALREWLLAVARHADPGPWKDRFRDAAVWRDQAALARLAREVDVGAVAPSTLFVLAAALRRRGGDAAPLLLASQARHSDDFWLTFELGCALHDAGRLDEAIDFYRAALALRPAASVVHANLGSALYLQQHLDEALAAFQKAVSLEPQFAYAHSGLGRVRYDQGRLDEAIAAFAKVVALDPRPAADHFNLGTALACAGRLDEAIAEYRQAIASEPEWARPRKNLAWALSRQS